MSNIKIAALGGVHENGKNMYLVEVDESIYILDCGLVYPPEEMLGIDVMIPDFNYLVENSDRIAGVFLSHGHPDAIGGVPYLIQELELPVFGTELTIELVKLQARQLGIKNYKDFHVINVNNEIDFGDVVVKFFKTTHSVPDSVGINIETKEGSIVYTGDFKFDMSVGPNYETDFSRITQMGDEGVYALLSDSRQAASLHDNASERVITHGMLQEVRNAPGRVIVAAVATNLNRLQQVFDVALAGKRHVFLSGDELEEIIDVAIRLDKVTIPSVELIKPIKDIDKYDDNQVLILETGKSGEPLQSLQNMARNRHRHVHIQPGDAVMIATSPSVEFETMVAETKNLIYRAGGEVIELAEDYKSSGHASPKDLQLMMRLLKPKYFVPINGEYRLMDAHRILAEEVGIPRDHIFLIGKGDVLESHQDGLGLAGKIQAGNVLIDGAGVGDIGNIVLRDRKLLSEDGIFVVVLTISRRLGKILAGPEIISRGFVYMKASNDLLNESKNLVTDIVNKHLDDKNFEWSKLKGDIRDQLSKKLYEDTQRRPMILPVIMEASNYRKRSK
ncbi:Zn-dependent hydrolase [Aerococcus urinaehominis]|uniref:Ribonuclease J n=1 Tax=Aerococcus urinaehominis TaxID=128944 RepID=A0A0X8FKG7_9LACT|nr:ribonuclease J [Aerococcus urinaehominis]AMB98983.1 Zn-dependent hydrolase [Aerococcus urinaehominis]SDM37860.1 ribonuclease J [Aerococcus urinaehominis]